MTETLEQKVRDSLERHAETVGTASERAAPQRALRRVRRRQGGTVLGAVVMVAALAAASVAGLRQLGNTSETTLGGTASTTTTATVAGVMITYPQGWYLEPLDVTAAATAGAAASSGTAGDGGALSTSPSPHFLLQGGILPLFALSNYEPGVPFAQLPDTQACTPTAALLAVQEGVGVSSGAAPERTWPVELAPSSDGLAPRGCSSAYVANWVSSGGGGGFHANAFFGPQVSPEDRLALFAAFDSMTFQPVPQPAISAPPQPAVDQATIDQGTTDGGATWTLSASRSDQGIGLELSWETGNSGAGVGIAPGNAADQPLTIEIAKIGPGSGAEDFIFGLTSPAVASVRLDGTGGHATLYDLGGPDADANAFLAHGPDLITQAGTLTALDASGKKLQTAPVHGDPNGYVSTGGSSSAQTAVGPSPAVKNAGATASPSPS